MMNQTTRENVRPQSRADVQQILDEIKYKPGTVLDLASAEDWPTDESAWIRVGISCPPYMHHYSRLIPGMADAEESSLSIGFKVTFTDPLLTRESVIATIFDRILTLEMTVVLMNFSSQGHRPYTTLADVFRVAGLKRQ